VRGSKVNQQNKSKFISGGLYTIMKHKLSKILGIGLTLALLASMLVTAVPVAAEEPVPSYAGYTLYKKGDATAAWSTEVQEGFGSYSAKLTIPAGSDWTDAARVIVPYGELLSTLTNDNIKYWYSSDGTPHNSFVRLDIDADGDGLRDYCLISLKQDSAVHDGTWTQTIQTDSWQIYTDEGVSGDWKTMAGWQADTDTFPVATTMVMNVRVMLGGPTTPSHLAASMYIDDITIAGITYDLEPIFLDAAFYQIGGTPTVTVCNGNVEEDRVLVSLKSGSAQHFTNIWAYEQSGNPGVFEGSFTLVSTLTGVNQLLVIDEDNVTAEYEGDWGTGDKIPLTDTATVDDTTPVVEITSPLDAYVKGNVEINADITETNPFTAVMEVDVVEETGTTDPMTYTWATDAADDGSHTILVTVTDGAGNVGSDSIDVTVDNTLPVIENAEATPPVVKPGEENTIVFTADVTDTNIDTVTIDLSSIGGDLDTAMLDGGVAPDEAVDGTYTAEITTTIAAAGSKDLTVTATDKATNEATADIELGVSPDTIPPVISDPAITYPFGISSAEPSDEVTLTATVTDNEAMAAVNPVTAACDVFEEDPVTLIKGEDNIYTGKGTVKSDAGWGDYPVTIIATDAEGNKATDETLILAVRYGATGVEIDLDAGWNLISLPLIPNSSDITVVISATTLTSEDVSNVVMVRAYDPATGEFPYHTPATGSGELTVMEDGVGYWVFMNEADTLTITGRQWPTPPMELPSSYDVVMGWNLIGFLSIEEMPDYAVEGEVEVGYLANIAGTYPVLWSYDAFAGAYSNVKNDLMEVGHGFWIWMTEPGTIVPPGPMPPAPE